MNQTNLDIQLLNRQNKQVLKRIRTLNETFEVKHHRGKNLMSQRQIYRHAL